MVSSSKWILTFNNFDSSTETWWHEKNNTQIQPKSWKFWSKISFLQLMTKVLEKSFSVRKLRSVLHSSRNFSSLSHQSATQKNVFSFFLFVSIFPWKWEVSFCDNVWEGLHAFAVHFGNDFKKFDNETQTEWHLSFFKPQTASLNSQLNPQT